MSEPKKEWPKHYVHRKTKKPIRVMPPELLAQVDELEAEVKLCRELLGPAGCKILEKVAKYRDALLACHRYFGAQDKVYQCDERLSRKTAVYLTEKALADDDAEKERG